MTFRAIVSNYKILIKAMTIEYRMHLNHAHVEKYNLSFFITLRLLTTTRKTNWYAVYCHSEKQKKKKKKLD